MSQPLVVSIPHRLGRQEAARRIKTGLGNARTNYAQWLTIEEETWRGESLQFRVRSVGQTADGKIEVFDDHVELEVTLPWLLAKFAEKLAPAIRKEGVLMLEKNDRWRPSCMHPPGANGLPKRESRRAVKPGGPHASAVVSGGWEYDRRASEIR